MDDECFDGFWCIANVGDELRPWPITLFDMSSIGDSDFLSRSINEFRKYFIELISKNNEKSISEEIELWMKQLRLKNDDDKTIGLLVLEGKA